MPALWRGLGRFVAVVGAGAFTAVLWLVVRRSGWGGAVPAALLGVALMAGALAVRVSSRWLLALAATAAAATVVELGTVAATAAVKPPEKAYAYEHAGNDRWFSEHLLVGYALRGPATLWATATVGDTVLYSDVRYDLDELGRRPCGPAPSAPRHALFFGGSFTFGEGLSNPQTLPCRFQEASGGEYRAWSYSMMGWGPAQAAVMLGVDSLFDDVHPGRGVAVFAFIADHVNRTVWRPGWSTDFPSYPLFDVDDDGRLVGPIRAAELEGGATIDRLVRLLTRESPFFKQYALPVLHDRVRDPAAVRTTAMVLAEAASRYRRRFDGRFIVALWPRQRLAPELEAILVGELERRDVTVITVAPLPGEPTAAWLHPLDSHPSGREAEWVARELLAATDRLGP